MDHEEKADHLARSICGKPSDVSPLECHSSWGRTNPLCSEYKTCRIAEKSEEQLDYVFSPTKSCVFLKACPGSGKTEVVGLKAAFEMMRWNKTPGGIAVLTFTNNAAKVIENRAGQFVGAKFGHPHFIGTIDSWLHGYIANPFAHIVTGYDGKNGDRSIRLIDNTSQADFLNAFKLDTRYSYHKKNKDGAQSLASMPLYANNIRYDHEHDRWEIEIPTSKSNEHISDINYFESNAFVEFRSDKSWLTLEYLRSKFKEKKKRFNQAGFATYQDIECICFELLSDDDKISQLLSRRFPFIIIDECQDLSWRQIQILDKLRLQGTVLHFVGDLNQAIYEFKKVDPEKVEEYAQKKKFKVLPLSSNYRSCQPISDLCATFVGNTYNVTCVQESTQDFPCVCVPFRKDEMKKLPGWFSDYLEQSGIDKQRSAVVTRSWANVSKMRPADSGQIKNYQGRLAMAIHLWKRECRQATEDALKYFGRFVSDKFFPKNSRYAREYYRPESVDSALTWRLFLAATLCECCQDEQLRDLERTWSDWAQAIISNFHNHLIKNLNLLSPSLSGCDFPPLVAQNKKVESSPVFSTPRGESKKQVLSPLPSDPYAKTPLRITTIHNVKGETLDALMLVSSLNARGTTDGYWTMWLDNPASEAARLAYVASSRPHHLLMWAIPDPSEEELTKLKNIGFHVLDAI